jgi:hypothetical protein
LKSGKQRHSEVSFATGILLWNQDVQNGSGELGEENSLDRRMLFFGIMSAGKSSFSSVTHFNNTNGYNSNLSFFSTQVRFVDTQKWVHVWKL